VDSAQQTACCGGVAGGHLRYVPEKGEAFAVYSAARLRSFSDALKYVCVRRASRLTSTSALRVSVQHPAPPSAQYSYSGVVVRAAAVTRTVLTAQTFTASVTVRSKFSVSFSLHIIHTIIFIIL